MNIYFASCNYLIKNFKNLLVKGSNNESITKEEFHELFKTTLCSRALNIKKINDLLDMKPLYPLNEQDEELLYFSMSKIKDDNFFICIEV